MIPAPRSGQHDAAPYTPATLAAALAGNRDAFAELWRAHHDEVFRYAYYRLADHATAEDITSETFAKALRNVGGFGEIRGAGMIGWLITIARNLIADLYKSSRHRREFVIDVVPETDAVTNGPDVDVLAQLQSAAVREAISRLTDDQRACIEARYLRGLSVAQTAQALGKNESAIKALQYRAVRTLGRLIDSDAALAEAKAH